MTGSCLFLFPFFFLSFFLFLLSNNSVCRSVRPSVCLGKQRIELVCSHQILAPLVYRTNEKQKIYKTVQSWVICGPIDCEATQKKKTRNELSFGELPPNCIDWLIWLYHDCNKEKERHRATREGASERASFLASATHMQQQQSQHSRKSSNNGKGSTTNEGTTAERNHPFTAARVGLVRGRRRRGRRRYKLDITKQTKLIS